ncbi:MAG: hypothetical protein ACMZ64_11640 [Oleiphilus sp.]
MTQNFIPAEIYALREDIEPEQVINNIKDGTLPGRQIDNTWHVEQINEQSSSSLTDTPPTKPEPIVKILNVFAGLSLIAGLFICFTLWPEKTYSRSPDASEYMTSVLWLIAGMLQFTLLAGLGKGLHYLRQIAENTKK